MLFNLSLYWHTLDGCMLSVPCIYLIYWVYIRTDAVQVFIDLGKLMRWFKSFQIIV